MNDNLVKIGAAVVGLVLGWASTSLTLVGRVDAIERSLQRIESHIFKAPAAVATPAPK